MSSNSEPVECAVCMDNIPSDETPLQCGHLFHKNCILSCNRLKCPLCRADIALSIKDFELWKERHKTNDLLTTPISEPFINYLFPNVPLNFSLFDLPFSYIEEIVNIPSKTFRYSMIPEIINKIATVYPEVNLMINPEAHVFSVLVTNGYSLY